MPWASLVMLSSKPTKKEKNSAAAIENGDGEMVVPDASSVGDGSYNPLARRIFMNVWNSEENLEKVQPLIKFGFSDEGDALVAGTGYVVLPDEDQTEMLSRVPAPGDGGDAAADDGTRATMATLALAGLVAMPFFW